MTASRTDLLGGTSDRWMMVALAGGVVLVVLGFRYGRRFDPTVPGGTTSLLVFTVPLTGVEIALLLLVAVLMAIVARTAENLLLAIALPSALPIGFGLGLMHPTYTVTHDQTVVPIIVASTLSLLAGAVGFFLGFVGVDGSS